MPYVLKMLIVYTSKTGNLLLVRQHDGNILIQMTVKNGMNICIMI